MRLSLRARVAVVSVVGVVLLGLVSFESYRSTADLARSARITAHTFEVIAKIELARSELADAQNEERGFLLTDNDSLWRAADSAEVRLGRTLTTLRALTVDEVQQRRRLDTVVPMLRDRLARLDEVMETRRTRGIAVAARAAAETSGARMNQEILNRLDAMAEDEFRVLASRDSTLEVGASHAEAITILGGVGLLAMGMVMLANDLKKRERMEKDLRMARDEAQEASAAKSAFLATMSHEIRTPMNGVIGMTELLLDTEPTPTQREYLSTVRSSAYALLGVINDILDFSKIEAGRLELEPIPFALRDSLASTVKTLSTRAAEKGLELICGISQDTPDGLVGDIGRLRQILLNLVGNAIKFTSEGEVALQVGVESAAEQEVLLHFTVTDTGIGIPQEKHSAIFEAFTQADRSTTRQYGGTGLGLTISSQLVTMFGGRIWVESDLGKGSRFHFTARFVRGEPSNGQAAATIVQVRGRSVLVVDDNATNRRILSELLGAWGMKVTLADSGAAALERLQDARKTGQVFSVAILDALMPTMDGFELAEKIREQEGSTVQTVMMLSSSGAAGQQARGRDAQIRSFLTKPVTQSDLLEAIQRILVPSSPERPVEASPTEPVARERTPMKILLVEDNRVNRQVATTLLQKRGHTVTPAENGRIAVDLTAREQFDLILMDVQMPEMDGIEATRLIRARETPGGSSRVPIVALTAHAMKGDAERFLSAGMDEYLSKPLNSGDLYALLARRFPAPASNEPGAAPFNETELLERMDGSRELLKEITAMYLEDAPVMLADVRHAVQSGNAAALDSSAHKLRGAVSNFGATTVSEKALALEQMGKSGKVNGAEGTLRDLERAMETLERKLRDYV